MTVLEQIASHRKALGEQAGARFFELADDIAQGREVAPDVADEVLSRAGKSMSDLEELVNRLKAIDECRAVIARHDEVLAKLREANKRMNEVHAERQPMLEEYDRRRAAAEKAFHLLDGEMDRIRAAQRRLIDLGGGKPEPAPEAVFPPGRARAIEVFGNNARDGFLVWQEIVGALKDSIERTPHKLQDGLVKKFGLRCLRAGERPKVPQGRLTLDIDYVATVLGQAAGLNPPADDPIDDWMGEGTDLVLRVRAEVERLRQQED